MRCRPIKNNTAWGTGVDIEDVDKFRTALHLSGHFLSKTFSKPEIEYCMSKGDPAVHFAGTFAAKEAVYKAVNYLCRGGVEMTDFQISHDKEGMPTASYNGADHEVESLEIKVSISHTMDYAVAVAFARAQGLE